MINRGWLILSLFVGFFLLWFVLSGQTQPILFIAGLVTALCLAIVNVKTDEKESQKILRTLPGWIFRSLQYIIWLLSRIILASFHVLQLILKGNDSLQPKIKRYKTHLPNQTARVVMANSITLTPGTISVDIEGNDILVHQIDKESAGDIESGLLEKKIRQLFKVKRS